MGSTLTPQEAIEALKASTEVTVGPELIAAALRMSPSVLRKHVRDGEYNISAYDIQGSRIRFFRKDFLQKTGELPMDSEEKTDHQLLDEICTKMDLLLSALVGLMDQDQRHEFVETWLDKKTAGAATPTEKARDACEKHL